MPAITTQHKKNMAILKRHELSEISKLHISPAARKPLYNPWLAARAFVGLNNSAGMDLNVFLPIVSQANISKYRKYKCSAAIIAIKILDNISIQFCLWFYT